MRKFVMGDIHGAHKAMLQCFERSNFDYESDLLIQLGDVVDGYPQVYECVEELLSVKNLIALKGNHDDWFDEFIKTEFQPYYWNYGGQGTLISYLQHVNKDGQLLFKGKGDKTGLRPNDIPETHKSFFNGQKPYFIDDENRCFVHAGFDRLLPFSEQNILDFYWDRSLWQDAKLHQANGLGLTVVADFKEIFIGHTPTQKSDLDKPLQAFNIYNIDTGTSHLGRLTIMDIETKEFWQSDPVTELYPSIKKHELSS